MNCIIVEDQAPAQRVLKKYILDYGNLHLQGVFTDPVEALEYLDNETVDLIFLDIHLPKLSGIDFLEALTNPPAVIFTTAFSDYAVRSYDFDAIDYLVKPFSFERFTRAVEKAKQKQESIDNGKLFFIKTGHEYVQIRSSSVSYICSDMDYTEFHFADKKLLSSETLAYWEGKLADFGFIRVHKSYLVNSSKITKVSGGQVVVEGDRPIPIGRAYKDSFLAKYVKQ